MERNNESRNRYSNDRNVRQSDQYNSNWNQPSDFQQNRNSGSKQNDNQWDNNSNDEDRDVRNSSGQYSGRNRNQENRNEQGRYGQSRSGRRLDAMGPMGNDTNRFDDDSDSRNYDRQNRRSSYGNAYGDIGSGNYDGGQMRNYDYGNRGGFSRYDDGNRYRGGSGFDNRNENRNWWEKTKDEVSGWFGDENAQQRRNNDQQGEHRGKGPKGYVRTDERIKEDVHERLTDDGSIDASDIEVDVKNGEVSLKGTVKNRQEKRRAEDIIENISGVKNVENHIKVQQENSGFGTPGQTSGQYGEKKFGSTTGSGINAGREFNTHN